MQAIQQKQTVYVSLVRNFLGKFIKFEIGPGTKFKDEVELRLYLNANYRHWWSCIYPEVDHQVVDEKWLKEGIIKLGLKDRSDCANEEWRMQEKKRKEQADA